MHPVGKIQCGADVCVLTSSLVLQRFACQCCVEPPEHEQLSSRSLLPQYLEGKAQLLYPEPADVFPVSQT